MAHSTQPPAHTSSMRHFSTSLLLMSSSTTCIYSPCLPIDMHLMVITFMHFDIPPLAAIALTLRTRPCPRSFQPAYPFSSSSNSSKVSTASECRPLPVGLHLYVRCKVRQTPSILIARLNICTVVSARMTLHR